MIRRIGAGAVLALALSVPAVASAQTADYPGDAAVEGITLDKGAPAAVAPASAAAPASQTLPFTGSDVTGLTVVGVLLIGGGVVITRRSRRSVPAE
jgi:LPXTG-motif cell wall-anchored protein